MGRTTKQQDHWKDARGAYIVPGDDVKVLGTRGKFTFICAWVGEDGSADIWVHGGPAAKKTRRAFSADRIVKILAKKQGAA